MGKARVAHGGRIAPPPGQYSLLHRFLDVVHKILTQLLFLQFQTMSTCPPLRPRGRHLPLLTENRAGHLRGEHLPPRGKYPLLQLESYLPIGILTLNLLNLKLRTFPHRTKSLPSRLAIPRPRKMEKCAGHLWGVRIPPRGKSCLHHSLLPLKQMLKNLVCQRLCLCHLPLPLLPCHCLLEKSGKHLWGERHPP